MRLSELKTGEKGVIVKVLGHGGFRKRIVEMGFVKGKTVEVLLNAASSSVSATEYPAICITDAITSLSATFIWQPYVSINNFLLSSVISVADLKSAPVNSFILKS